MSQDQADDVQGADAQEPTTDNHEHAAHQPEQHHSASPAGWYPDPSTGQQRYWDGSQWLDVPPPSGSGPASVTISTPSKIPWKTIGIVVGIIAVVGIGIALFIASRPDPRDAKLADAYTACAPTTSPSKFIDLAADGKSITLQGIGQDAAQEDQSTALVTDVCVLAALKVPDSVVSRMEKTRALDGTQTDTGQDWTIRWTYHPDDGLNVVIEETH